MLALSLPDHAFGNALTRTRGHGRQQEASVPVIPAGRRTKGGRGGLRGARRSAQVHSKVPLGPSGSHRSPRSPPIFGAPSSEYPLFRVLFRVLLFRVPLFGAPSGSPLQGPLFRGPSSGSPSSGTPHQGPSSGSSSRTAPRPPGACAAEAAATGGRPDGLRRAETRRPADGSAFSRPSGTANQQERHGMRPDASAHSAHLAADKSASGRGRALAELPAHQELL